jgi:hypothetical protein
MVTRLIFCAPYRIPIATISLRFDHNLLGVDRTIIVSPIETGKLFGYLSRYDIDTNQFEHVHDAEIESHYPEIQGWRIPNDPRNNWLAQQALKLSALDYFDFDIALIHDPDTWLTEPYQCITDQLTLVALENITEGSYDQQMPSILGWPRMSHHCFVTELMPVRKSDWHQLRSVIEQTHRKHFLSAIIDALPGIPTLDGQHNLKWFSEYELLGNWSLRQGPVNLWFQRRFEFQSLSDFDLFDPAMSNAMCDQSPGHSPLLAFDDWHHGTVPNHDAVIKRLSTWFDL